MPEQAKDQTDEIAAETREHPDNKSMKSAKGDDERVRAFSTTLFSFLVSGVFVYI